MIRFDDETLLEFLMEYPDPPTTLFNWAGLVEYRSPIPQHVLFFRGKAYFVALRLSNMQMWSILGAKGFVRNLYEFEADLNQDGYLTYDNDYKLIFVKEEKVNG